MDKRQFRASLDEIPNGCWWVIVALLLAVAVVVVGVLVKLIGWLYS